MNCAVDYSYFKEPVTRVMETQLRPQSFKNSLQQIEYLDIHTNNEKDQFESKVYDLLSAANYLSNIFLEDLKKNIVPIKILQQYVDHFHEELIINVNDVYNNLKGNISKENKVDQVAFNFIHSFLQTIIMAEKNIELYHYDNFTEEYQQRVYDEINHKLPNEHNRVTYDGF